MRIVKSSRFKKIWLLSGCIIIIFIIVIGGITRLTHSGLSISHWEFFEDNYYPLEQNQWQLLFDEYKQYPEYQQVNIDYSLQDFKDIFFCTFIDIQIW